MPATTSPQGLIFMPSTSIITFTGCVVLGLDETGALISRHRMAANVRNLTNSATARHLTPQFIGISGEGAKTVAITRHVDNPWLMTQEV